ncbi:response regulator [Marivirga sp. S37H4]|uniref:histidine kinase n=1 Tax=Marivirga aurantiaca TaxID=2802615 RepID=A0A934WW13_9BACT|nr:ATP-binding protein [Marivirga aurantiaca]MBK6263977.1 response regulator [Marivirga aurantiaca]
MSYNSPKKNRSTSALTKLWIVLIIIIITAGSILFWGYNNYDKLLQSLNQITEPNQKAALINELFQEIVEADNHFSSYVLTDDTSSERMYMEKISSVQYKLNELEELLQEDSVQRERIDSLQSTIEAKNSYLTTFLNLKKEKVSALFTSEALARISNQIQDSTFVEKELRRKQRIVGSVEPVEKEKIVIKPDDYEGISGFFRKLFGKENMELDTIRTIEEQINYSLDLSVDTSIVRDYFIDTTLSAVKNILVEVLAEEMEMQQKLNSIELELISQDQKFITIIRSIISELQAEEYTKNVRQQNMARIQAQKLTRELVIIGVVGIALSSIFIFLILRDITRAGHYRKKLEEEKKRAEQLAKVKEEFLSKMSHEIRTPLHSIIGFSDLMRQSKLDENQQKYLNAIAESNSHLKELIDDVLDQAKIDAGKLTLDKKPVFVPQLVEELKLIFMQKFESNKLRFEVSVSDFLSTHIFISDLFKIKQVLMNLIGNAIKFTEEGYVKVTFDQVILTDESCQIHIEVSDTGKGIKEEEFSKIFEQFQQGTSGKLIGIAGTGLGLSITKSIVQLLGGNISLESQIGKGSIFKLNFQAPYETCPEQFLGHTDIKVEELFDQTQHFPIRIVVVEDDPWNAQLLMETLRPITDSQTLFSNAEDAVAYLSSDPEVDIIFTDINLPEMSGVQFLQHCKREGLNVPIIALTAHIQQSKKEEFLRAGFDAVCIKPFTKEDVMKLLNDYFEADTVTINRPVNGEIKQAITTLDTSVLKEFANNDQEAYNELLISFSEEYSAKIKRLKRAFEFKDISAIGGICHQLKSALEQLHYNSLSENLLSIELFADMKKNQRVLEEIERILPVLNEIEKELKDIRHQSHIL